MGFGTGPFGNAVGYTVTTPFDEATTILVSSKKINFATGEIIYDEDGNPEGMDDTAQRVALLLRQAKFPSLIGLDFEATVDGEIRERLAPLTDGATPAITIAAIVVAIKLNGNDTRVDYINNLTGTQKSVTL